MSIIWKIGLEILLKQIEVPVLNTYEQVILFCFDVRIFVFPISNLDEIVQRFKKLLAQTFGHAQTRTSPAGNVMS